MCQIYEVKRHNVKSYLRVRAKKQIYHLPFIDLCTKILTLSTTMYLKLSYSLKRHSSLCCCGHASNSRTLTFIHHIKNKRNGPCLEVTTLRTQTLAIWKDGQKNRCKCSMHWEARWILWIELGQSEKQREILRTIMYWAFMRCHTLS